MKRLEAALEEMGIKEKPKDAIQEKSPEDSIQDPPARIQELTTVRTQDTSPYHTVQPAYTSPYHTVQPAYDSTTDSVRTQRAFYTMRSDTLAHSQEKTDESTSGLISNKIIIKRVRVQADTQSQWEVWFWRTSRFDNTDMDGDGYSGHVSLTEPQATTAWSSRWYYDSGEVNIPYEDLDGRHTMHWSFINRHNISATVVIEVDYEPS